MQRIRGQAAVPGQSRGQRTNSDIPGVGVGVGPEKGTPMLYIYPPTNFFRTQKEVFMQALKEWFIEVRYRWHERQGMREG